MQKAIYIIVSCLLFTTVNAQFADIGVLGGLNYGGPIGKVDSATGQPLLGFEAGLFTSFKISERWYFKPSLYYTTKGADYSQFYTRDTIVEIEIQGVKGEVPTFYRANVNGAIRMHYLELPLSIAYKNKKRFFVETGPYFSYLLKGKDRGHVHLDIGEDGFLSDDRDYAYDDAIHQLEYGINLTGGYEFDFGMSIYLKGTRSLNRLYRTSHFEEIEQSEVKLYNTLVALGIRYKIFGSKVESS